MSFATRQRLLSEHLAQVCLHELCRHCCHDVDAMRTLCEAISSGVQAVKAAWAEKTITHFRVSYKRLHGDTDFERWMTAEAPYNVWDTDAE